MCDNNKACGPCAEKKALKESMNKLPFVAIKDQEPTDKLKSDLLQYRDELKSQGYTTYGNGYYWHNFTGNKQEGPALGIPVGSDTVVVKNLTTGKIVRYQDALLYNIIQSKNLEAPLSVKLTESKKAKKTNILNEKVDLKLTSYTKREMIKQAKTALDSVYALYDLCEKNKITNDSLLNYTDGAFENVNEILTILVVQNSIEPK